MAFIKNIYCKPAPFEYSQENLLDFMKSNMNIGSDRKMNLFSRNLYLNSGIKKRYSCLNNEYFNTKNKLSSLTTAERQKIYEESSEKLIQALAEKIKIKNKIDNLITASCTGYMTTGLDFMMLKYLKVKY